MRNEMRRGRSQVLWRYMPGAVFRYNEGSGWSRTTQVALKDTEALRGALQKALGVVLRRWRAIGPSGYPEPEQQVHRYVVGEPMHVMYEAWPIVFSCRQCKRVQYYKDIATLRQYNDRLSCKKCKGADQLKQIAYGYVCECGRIDTLFVPRCPSDPTHSIELINKGSFQESYWRCQECRAPIRRNTREGLGFRRCECQPGKGMRGVPLEDSRVYYSQTLAIVDVKDTLLERWHDNPRFSDLLVAAAVKASAYAPSHLSSLARWKPLTGGLSPELEATLRLLVESGMDRAQAEAIVRQGAKAGEGDPWVQYDASLIPLREFLGNHDWTQSPRTLEYVFVRDEPTAGALGLDRLITEAEERDKCEEAERLRKERGLAKQLGFESLAVVRSLPVMLAAFGYSRYYGSPREATDADSTDSRRSDVSLRPFPEDSGKIPIYVARNTTEALLFELDPWRLGAFVAINAGVTVPVRARASTEAMRAWLLSISADNLTEGESHLVLDSWEVENGKQVNLPGALTFGVVHTVAHVLKAVAHRFVGIDGDSLAEYLFPAHGAGVIYVSSHVEFTLGGIDAVFRANLTQWLGSARDYAGRCSLDPVCAHSGGACLACLYPKFGCAHFNRTVSRAFLFGGETPGFSGRLVGFWLAAVSDEAERLRTNVVAG